MTERGYGLIDTILWSSLYSCTSFFFFTSLSTFLESYVLPGHLRQSQKKTWKWVNYAVSWVHSTLSGSLGILCLCLTPTLLDDVILGYSETAYIAICISYGYFLHDTLDIINNHDKDKANSELVIHHTFAVSTAALIVYTRTYIGWSTIALLIELHSAILHTRVLFKMYYGSSIDLSTNKYYTWIKWINLVFFFLFRFSPLILMIYGLIRDYPSAPNLPIYCFLCLTAGVILVLSILLFKRVFQADFIDIKTSDASKNLPSTDKVFQSVIKSNETQNISSIIVPGVSPLQEQINNQFPSHEKPLRESNSATKTSSSITQATVVPGVPNNFSTLSSSGLMNNVSSSVSK